MTKCEVCGKEGTTLCFKCATQIGVAKGNGRAFAKSTRADDNDGERELERQQLAAGWEASSYGYDEVYGGDGNPYLPDDDFYDE